MVATYLVEAGMTTGRGVCSDVVTTRRVDANPQNRRSHFLKMAVRCEDGQSEFLARGQVGQVLRIDDRTNLEDTVVNQTLQVRRHLQELAQRRKTVRPEDLLEPETVGLKWLSSHDSDFIQGAAIRETKRFPSPGGIARYYFVFSSFQGTSI